MSFQKVAVVGGSGNLGTHIVQALLDAEFTVTAVSRLESTATFPSGVMVKRADLCSVASIRDAISGNDAVVSVAATEAAGNQRPLVDAVIAARIARFIPSEFGFPSRRYRHTKIGAFIADKVATTDYLIELAEKHEWFSWTGLSNGLFFDWALRSGAVFLDPKNRKASIVDSGDELFSSSSLSFIAKAVVAILQRPTETANKFLLIAGLVTTQNEIVKMAEDLTGSKFDVNNRKSTDLELIADEKLAKQDYSAFIELLEQYMYADGAGHALKHEDSAHELLGLEPESLCESVQKIIN